MSHPNDNDDATPLFAHLLVDDEQPTPAAGGGGTTPTTHCLDSECTKKYPSDADDCYSYKPYCDFS